MDRDRDEDMELQHYIDIGAISLEGVDENGEMIFSISENAKDIAPELWEAHIKYVDESLMELYQAGLMEVEYDENLEATFFLSDEGKKIAKELGLIELDFKDTPNN